MLVRTFGLKPFYAPDTETGAAGAEGGAPPAGGEGGTATEPEAEGGGEAEQEPHNGPGSGRSKVRQQLEAANATAKKNQAERDKRGQYQSRARQELAPDGTQVEGQPQEGQQQQLGQQQAVAAPEGWPKEAKAAWNELPPVVQQAALKREADMAAGVKALKDAHAEVDSAVAPFMDAIKHHKTTPGAAIGRLFGWMDALTKEAALLKNGQPSNGAFAGLCQSYGIDPVRLLATMVQNPQQRQMPGQQQQPQNGQPQQIDPATKAYLDSILGTVHQQVGGLAQTLQQQNFAKTNEVLGMWSKDKPHYEEVRQHMAKLLAPGPNGEPAAVPPLANGNADLDTAYEMACYGIKSVREKMLAEQQAAEAKKKADAAAAEKTAQKTKLEQARKASGSIAISAPGVPFDGKNGKKPQRQSVRESINAAVKEVNDR